MRLLERWPPAAWIAVYIASLLILIGGLSAPAGRQPALSGPCPMASASATATRAT